MDSVARGSRTRRSFTARVGEAQVHRPDPGATEWQPCGVVIEVVPEKWITDDAGKMMADTAPAMAEHLFPERWSRNIEHLGDDPTRVAHALVAMLGLDNPRGAMGPRQRVRAMLGRLMPGNAP